MLQLSNHYKITQLLKIHELIPFLSYPHWEVRKRNNSLLKYLILLNNVNKHISPPPEPMRKDDLFLISAWYVKQIKPHTENSATLAGNQKQIAPRRLFVFKIPSEAIFQYMSLLKIVDILNSKFHFILWSMSFDWNDSLILLWSTV